MLAGDQMPSTLSGHVYTMLASALIGALLVASINSYSASLKTASEIQKLQNLVTQVAAKGTQILSLTTTTNSSVQVFVQMPATIGYQQYWLRVRNDSSSAWIEGSFDQKTALNRAFLPKGTSASGIFVGGYGPAVLRSYMNGSTPQLDLFSLGG